MKKIAFILHGKLRNQPSLLQTIQQAFVKQSVELKFYFTEKLFHGFELTQRAIQEGAEYVISVGGDGTLNEVVNGVLTSGNPNIKIGLLPYGSGNDFIKTIQSPKKIEELADLISKQQYRQIDAMQITCTSKEGNSVVRYGANITDVGIGGEIAENLNGSSKILGATITFQYYIISTLLGYKAKHISVHTDTFTYENEIMNFCICNGKYFGAGLGISPKADLQDGLLNIVTIGKVNLLDYFKNLPLIKKCLPLTHPQVEYFTAKEISIKSIHPNMPIDMDGEFVGFLPMRVNVLPGAVLFIA